MCSSGHQKPLSASVCLPGTPLTSSGGKTFWQSPKVELVCGSHEDNREPTASRDTLFSCSKGDNHPCPTQAWLVNPWTCGRVLKRCQQPVSAKSRSSQQNQKKSVDRCINMRAGEVAAARNVCLLWHPLEVLTHQVCCHASFHHHLSLSPAQGPKPPVMAVKIKSASLCFIISCLSAVKAPP